ncbi:cytochrome b [Anianabacter salinae]|uniref:cytochrome b n=1 Tax=Anianabacter salinae TaxID=2851023 RepID=UPI00225E0E42|nr:cytochrome b/b6 domain-containing protein [Anianabacter salinae]MBV0913903.1 cytochrome b/b6 domain-containing protein [Anianabacter salinae]
MSTRPAYSPLQIGLHWLVAILIFAAWFTHEDMGQALRQRIETGATGIEGNTLHVWLGGAAFLLILARIVVRMVSGAPAPEAQGGPLMAKAAVWGHRLLYALMILAPMAGAAAWYGGVREAGEVHETLGSALFFIALAHAVVALVHHYVLKDGTLLRMIRPKA